ncbi:rotatin isoform X2 [Periplaneta americana]|uniref:rotatin isoform X2 n=1 Tax=Periplaneta americana TaxID=6978 RepID=UPI0037E8DA15
MSSIGLHIQKLGHKLEEIRVRALNNILSKLDCGFICEKELSNHNDLVVKLFDWFNFDNPPEKEKVLNLILRLLKADVDGKICEQIRTCGGRTKLYEIRTKVEPNLLNLIDEILNSFNSVNVKSGLTEIQQEQENIYWADESEPTQRSVGTTATPLEGEVQGQKVSNDLQSSPTEVPHQLCHGYFTGEDERAGSTEESCFHFLILPWQPLVATDRHVLLAVEESLTNTTDLPLVLHTCQFFTDVMLQDFPAEVFLQRPAILKVFLDLLDSDKRVSEAVLNCLWKLSTALRARIRYYSDPGIANLKQETCKKIDSNFSNSVCTSRQSSAASETEQTYPDHFKTNSAENIQDSTEYQEYQQNVSSEGDFSSEDTEDSVLLQLQQLSLPQYCVLCLFHSLPHFKSNRQNNVNLCSLLGAELVTLLAMCMKPSFWFSSDPVAQEAADHLKQVLMVVGGILDELRSAGVNNGASRLTYLQLLALTHNLLMVTIPFSVGDSILNRKLKSALTRSLTDFSVITFFPTLHKDIVQYVKLFQSPSEKDFIENFENAMTIYSSMKSAVRFLKNYDKLEKETFVVLNESLPSLPFHGNLNVVKLSVEVAVSKLHQLSLNEDDWKVVTEVILKLLSHVEPTIRLEMYSCCHSYVVSILGVREQPRLSVDTSRQLNFLYNSAVLKEIICHGASSLDKKIRQYAEEILIHLLKGKFLLSDSVWRQFLEQLIPELPLLQCYADKTTAFGRAVIKIFDPETSQSIHLPRIEVMKGNLRLLFCSDALTREEALLRLTWILTREERAFEKLPDFSSLRGVLLNSVCLLDHPIDLGVNRVQKNFYQVSSLSQVVELLQSKVIEPVVRRAALTQISVMLEDINLHDVFFQLDGVNLILDTLHHSLVKKDFKMYPDAVIPCIHILRILVQHNPKLRQDMSHHAGLLSYILRAVYLYNGDRSLRPDSSMLLCLLLYSDYILSVPEPADSSLPWHCLSLPDLVARNMRLPIVCHTHWRSSPHTEHSPKRELQKYEDCCSFLRLCWSVEWFGGLDVVLEWSSVPSSEEQSYEFANELKLSQEDLDCLKATAVSHRAKLCFYDVQNATTHSAVKKPLNSLTGYLALQILVRGEVNSMVSSKCWHDFPWADSFKRFLEVPPSCPEDQQLLISILQFLRLYFNACSDSEQDTAKQICWITTILKDATQPLPSLLLKLADMPGGSENASGMSKEMCRELLKLVQECAAREKKSRHVNKNSEHKSESWIHIIRAITENLTFSDTQHFYNLAFLDWMLSCLTQLTSSQNWSNCTDFNVHRLWSELISSLTELVTAFHCGKGGASLASFMGLSITRSAVLCMNHLLCEMQNSTSNKGWEFIWLCALGAETYTTGRANLSWLPPLWLSRDPVVRSAALQLVAGFSCSLQGCGQLLSGLSSIAGGAWGAGLSFLLDHEEASIVREQAALLLSNLSSHSVLASGESATLNLCHASLNSIEVPQTGVEAVLSLLSQSNFYREVALLLSRLNVGSTVDANKVYGHGSRTEAEFALDYNRNIDSNSSNGHQESSDFAESLTGHSLQLEPLVKTTPSLVKAVCWLMVNLLALDSTDALHHINKCGLVRLLFSCLVTDDPQENTELNKATDKVLLRVDLIEMWTAVCCVLSKCVAFDEDCHTSLLHTHDCVHSLLALLCTLTDSTHFTQLMLLWVELFKLFSAILSRRRGFEAVRDALYHCGPSSFFSMLKTAVQNDVSTNLCFSGLNCLTSLLAHEIDTESVLDVSRSLKHLLDNGYLVDSDENKIVTVSKNSSESESQSLECVLSQEKSSASETKCDLFENTGKKRNKCLNYPTSSKVCKGKLDSVHVADSISPTTVNRVVGEELCNLLVHLYEVYSISKRTKGRSSVMRALSSLLAVSAAAKRVALSKGLLETLLLQLKELHIKLSLESADNLQRVSDKKRVCPVLKDVGILFAILTNFLHGDTAVKQAAAEIGLADLVHKLWVWCCLLPNLLKDVLKLLSTFTNSSHSASLSLIMTTTVLGVGLRKTPSSLSLLHVLVNLVQKEMELINRVHETEVLKLTFQVLTNACHSPECRNIFAKTNLFHCLHKLHPTLTKKQKHWDVVELMWLNFLSTFTFFPEGQQSIPKIR